MLDRFVDWFWRKYGNQYFNAGAVVAGRSVRGDRPVRGRSSSARVYALSD